jgi:uncharacterized cupredoxin-like copper-binding protein
MRFTGIAPVAAVAAALFVAACSGGGASPAPATQVPVATEGASAAATRVEVTLSDALKVEPAAMTVPAGQPVTFVVTNTGTVQHEFVLGDEAEQMAHEEEMASSDGMNMGDEEMAISVDPGMTKELTVTSR